MLFRSVLHLCLRAEKHPAPSVRGILRWKDFHPSCTESESPPCLRQADSLCELQEALQMLARVSHMEGRTLNDKGWAAAPQLQSSCCTCTDAAIRLGRPWALPPPVASVMCGEFSHRRVSVQSEATQCSFCEDGLKQSDTHRAVKASGCTTRSPR